MSKNDKGKNLLTVHLCLHHSIITTITFALVFIINNIKNQTFILIIVVLTTNSIIFHIVTINILFLFTLIINLAPPINTFCLYVCSAKQLKYKHGKQYTIKNKIRILINDNIRLSNILLAV